MLEKTRTLELLYPAGESVDGYKHFRKLAMSTKAEHMQIP